VIGIFTFLLDIFIINLYIRIHFYEVLAIYIEWYSINQIYNVSYVQIVLFAALLNMVFAEGFNMHVAQSKSKSNNYVLCTSAKILIISYISCDISN
jgi:hypothetical protein